MDSVLNKWIFKFLEGEVEIFATFSAGVLGTTEEKLAAAAQGARYEHTELFPAFAKIAAEEGFHEVATAFRSISIAEKQHEKRYTALRATFLRGEVLKRPTPGVWHCRNRGYLHEELNVPGICPTCVHRLDHFELLGEHF